MQLTDTKITCFHCGLECEEETVLFQEKSFCCNGCKVVYEILSENELCEYYDISQTPGVSQRLKSSASQKFSVLDTSEIKQKLIRFTDGEQTHIVFFLPQIHCSSCIWLLENLNRINPAIISSRVDFTTKEITVIYKEKEIALKEIADILTSVGYEPYLNLNDVTNKKPESTDRGLIYKLGIAGFCFGNIMMLSFPEYFGDGTVDPQLQKLFSSLNLILSLPVFFYSASLFYKSAWAGLKKKFLNIDAPIVLAILITFIRSVYEILSGTGAGYLDSMAGIVFFMLIGRYLQDRTYKKLSFERDYRSYFPIAVTVKRNNDVEENIPVTDIKVGDRMIIRNNELIPADAILFYGDANIDYSFVTGESAPIKKSTGEIIYAGGKQKGSSIEMEVVKEVSNSYLTELWNKDVFRNYEDKKLSFIHKLSQYFTLVLFTIAGLTAIYWGINDPSRVLNAVSAILIIACPCALLLSATFTNGNVLRIFGQNGLYLKNATVIEMIAEADTIVFDKTGTITQNGAMKVSFSGNPLTEDQETLIRSLAIQSTHPYSKAITHYLPKLSLHKVQNLMETAGAGLEGKINGSKIKLGSASYTGAVDTSGINTGKVYVSVDDHVLGCFTITNKYREGMEKLIINLDKQYGLSVISGDNDAEQPYLEKIFSVNSTLHFNQTPESKLKYINDLQARHKKVMMVGDGLNDAGALKQSNVGIAVSDEVNNFSPACDAILDGNQLNRLGVFIKFAKAGKAIVVASFIISILYNFVGLSFAVQGILSPVIAAILMPASSLTIILFTMGTSSLIARFWGMR